MSLGGRDFLSENFKHSFRNPQFKAPQFSLILKKTVRKHPCSLQPHFSWLLRCQCFKPSWFSLPHFSGGWHSSSFPGASQTRLCRGSPPGDFLESWPVTLLIPGQRQESVVPSNFSMATFLTPGRERPLWVMPWVAAY